MLRKCLILLGSLLCLLVLVPEGNAVDFEQTRQTLSNIPGFMVVIEELQPCLLKYKPYLQKFGLNKDQLQNDVEKQLKAAGIKILSSSEWQKTRGNPILYININTHEKERFSFAYDVRVEIQQVVAPEANPKTRIMATTWSINITGMADIGTLSLIQKDLTAMVDRFIQAYRAVNGRI